MMKIVSVILARGGSKGIKKKNIIEIKNKPLIAFAIEASNNSLVDETWVSTDNEEIAYVSGKYGANILNRPKELATDTSKSEDALVHFANNVDFDILVFIQPTSPLLSETYINDGIKMMDEYDSVFSAYREHWIPRWTLDSKPIDWDIYDRPRRQDVDASYVENGSFYITTKENLLRSNLRYSGKIGVVEMPLGESFQIDTMEDLNFIKKII